jgi:GH24 family phage-related lysozyme (muramidase)
MDTIDNYFTENPIDITTLNDVGDPTKYNSLLNEMYRGAYRDGGFVSPTIGVTVEDTMLDLPHGDYVEMLENEVYSKIGPSAFDTEAGRYNRDRFDFITGHRIFSQNVQKDAIGRNVIGYEFNLDNAENFALAAGVLGKTPKQMQALMDGTEGVSSRESRALYEAQVAQADKLISELTDGAPLRGPQRMTLTSLVMHNPALLGPNLVKHIKNGDVQKAILEIRDKSNGTKNKSLALRRKQEAMHFGHYSINGLLETTSPELLAQAADHFGMPKPRKVTAPETSLKPQLRPNQGAKVEGGGVKRSLRPRLRPTVKPDSGLQSSLKPRLRPDDMPVPASAGGVARSLLPQLRPDSVGTEALVSELEIALGVEKPTPVDTAIDNNIVPVVVPDTDGEITVTSLGNTDTMRLSEELGAAIENAGMSTEMNDALKQISGSMNDKLAELDVDMDSAMFFDNTRDYIAARDAGELVEGDEIVIGTDGNLSTFLYTEGRDDPRNAAPTVEPVSQEVFLDDTNMTTVSAFKKAERASRATATQADTEDRLSTVQSVLERNRKVLDKSNYTFGTITDTSEEDFEVTISTSGDVYDSEGTLMDAYVEDGTVFNRAGAVIGSFVEQAADLAVTGATVAAGGVALATIAAYEGVKGIAEGTINLAKKVNQMGGLAFSTPGRLLIGDIVQPDFFKKNVIKIDESYLTMDEFEVLMDIARRKGAGKVNSKTDYKGAGSIDVRGDNSPELSNLSGMNAASRMQKSFGDAMIKVIDGHYYLVDQYDFNIFVDYSDTNAQGKGKVYNTEEYEKKFGGLGVAKALSITMGSDRTLFDKIHNLAFIMGSRDYEGTNKDVGRQVRIKLGPVDKRVASN